VAAPPPPVEESGSAERSLFVDEVENTFDEDEENGYEYTYN